MKALIYTAPETLAYRDAPDPNPAAGEVVVGVEAVGICGSDMHAFLGHDERRPAPLVLGHEAAGRVIEGRERGRRVTVNPLVTCMTCDVCLDGRTNLCRKRQIISMPPRPGAFAEKIAIPERNILDVPDDFPIEQAALCEPLACGWHAAKTAARVSTVPLPAARCFVIGGGAIGFGAALALSAFGAAEVAIVEPNPLRRAALKRAGQLHIFDPEHANGAQENAQIVIDAYGDQSSRGTACRAVQPGGVIVHIGLVSATGGLDARRMTLQEVAFIGTYTYTMTDFRETFAAMIDGRLKALDWFESRPLADGAAAFADIRAGRVAAPKIMLRL